MTDTFNEHMNTSVGKPLRPRLEYTPQYAAFIRAHNGNPPAGEVAYTDWNRAQRSEFYLEKNISTAPAHGETEQERWNWLVALYNGEYIAWLSERYPSTDKSNGI